jgi:hypothetical protein
MKQNDGYLSAEILANTRAQSYPFATVPNMSSMEFGLVEESSLVRHNSLLVARGSNLQSYDAHPHTMTEYPPKATVSTMIRST